MSHNHQGQPPADIHHNESDGESGSTTQRARDKQAKLTQIGQILKSTNTQNGFAQAQQDADRALKANKIILNQRFVLDSSIGAGGMGSVYKAQDLRRVEASDNNPYVAIKVLSGDFKNHPDAFVALQREASRSAKLSHPNIVTVYDFDRDGDTVFMTMELLQGEDLDSLIKRHEGKGLPKNKALPIIADFCRALSFAHKKGVIHCDLKPANIFLDKEGAKVLDFGIARLAIKTKDHFDAGRIGAFTPGYASLEMFHKETPQPSDDVFAAAIIAYELLTGRHPYDGQSAPVALGLNRQPEPVKGLSSRQWRALSNALQLEAANRTPSIDLFLKGLIGPSKFAGLVPIVASAAVIAAVAVGYVIYSGDYQLKKKVSETLNAAQTCFQKNDFNCTIDNANVILKIESNHAQAKELLAKARDAKARFELEQQIDELQSVAKLCLSNNDFSCASKALDEALVLTPENQELLALQQKVNDRAREHSENISSLLIGAKECFEKKYFNCTIEKAKQALGVEADNTEAQSLLQSANYEIKQKDNALAKAKSILTDGQDCFKKYDYSCAIAKAESALAFVENYAPAIKLKKDAERAIANAKKAITIE
ncbi:serine/threonine protein kinase [Pleionea sediminis]|uniref:serine/threonine protein kinase n=1 Tax=Pleionea sediminis TaxID=2569479 RepID=UPI001185514F|nr:protein kinase [Pleionea sediminis]